MSPKDHLITYFRPGQLVFHARDTFSGADGQQKIARLNKWANDAAANWAKKSPKIRGTINLTASPENIIRFNPGGGSDRRKQRSRFASETGPLPGPSVPQQEVLGEGRPYQSPPITTIPPFSLIFSNVQSDKWIPLPPPQPDENDPANLVLNLSPKQQEEQANILKELLDLAAFLDDRRWSAPVKLEVVSLNWLMSGSKPSDPGDTGGPGGPPSPVGEKDINKHQFHLPPKLPLGTGEDVVVAILDTAYDSKKLEEIYDTWVLQKVEKGETPHPHIQALLGKEPFDRGALRRPGPGWDINVYTDPPFDLETYNPGIEIDGHDYDMTDHGLFVAGIINSIAPQAELHIYRVLNKYGVGDLVTLGTALEKVINDFQGKQMVVNLSLTMNMPLKEGYLKDNDLFGMGRAILDYKLSHKPSALMQWICPIICWIFERLLHRPCPSFCASWFERQARPFEWICDLVYALDSRVIAAAGNESKGKAEPLEALYPAAFDRVFGVGALARGDPPRSANYSNLADQPASKGITTLGGEEGKRNGVLGVYVGKFPPDDKGNPQPNNNGWAWWSGTSFATPIISGATAAILSRLGSPTQEPSTEEAIAQLYTVPMNSTIPGESIFDVDQS